MKALSRILQSIACLWLAVGFAMPLQGGIFINSYRFSSAGGPTAFLATVNNSSAGFTLPLVSGSTYDFYVDWGDGSAVDHITAWNQAKATHYYPTSGSYQMSITGTMPRWAFTGGGSCTKLLSIDSWGAIAWSSMNEAFDGCSNMTSIATGGNFSACTDFYAAFFGCSSLTTIPAMNWSAATEISYAFYGCSSMVTFSANVSGANTCRFSWSVCGALTSFSSATFPTAGVNYSHAFTSSGALRTMPAFDFSSATDLSVAWYGCSLTSFLATGMKADIYLAYNNLNAAALNTLMTNLATVSGKTITISGNPGYATCTTSIATSKGWTVN